MHECLERPINAHRQRLISEDSIAAPISSRRKYEILAQRDVGVPMRDGISLNVHVFRPAAPGRFPALVGLAPFHLDFQDEYIWPSAARSSRTRGSPTVNVESIPRDFFVRRGYVKVVGASRGTGKSGGVYQYTSPQEALDNYDLIEWTAQQPWCDGNVGMAGIAYYAALQMATASLHPPHLKAIAPLFAFWDDYRDSWWEGGILANGFLKWVNNLVNNDLHADRSVLADELGVKGFKAQIERALGDKDISADPGLVNALKNPAQLGHAAVLDILLHPYICGYWNDRGAGLKLDDIKVPSYFGAASHRPGPLFNWGQLHMPKKMVCVPPAYVDRPFYQLSWEMLEWFDHWLKGVSNGFMQGPPVRIFVTGSDEWVAADDFPLPGTNWIPLNLQENRRLAGFEPPSEAASTSYDDAPKKRGFLKFYSNPLSEHLQSVGLASLVLYVSCRQRDANVFASLWDAAPDGRETCVSRGYLKLSHRELDAQKSRPWHPVHRHLSTENLVPGQVYQIVVGFHPVANSFKAGHRIGLKIGGADDDPENLFQVGMYHLSSQDNNTVTVYHCAEYPSHILLPITRGNLGGF